MVTKRAVVESRTASTESKTIIALIFWGEGWIRIGVGWGKYCQINKNRSKIEHEALKKILGIVCTVIYLLDKFLASVTHIDCYGPFKKECSTTHFLILRILEVRCTPRLARHNTGTTPASPAQYASGTGEEQLATITDSTRQLGEERKDQNKNTEAMVANSLDTYSRSFSWPQIINNHNRVLFFAQGATMGVGWHQEK